jgi:Ca2+-binding RTX toxin-like protein
VYGSAYADWLMGSSAAETFIGGAGNDNINGGAGIDRAEYSTSTAGARVNLDSVSQTLNGVVVAASTASDGFGGIDTLTSIERIQGSAYADWITGGAAADTFAGGAGNDTLNGGAGTDTLDYSGSTAAVLVNLSTASQTLNATAVAAGTARDGWAAPIRSPIWRILPGQAITTSSMAARPPTCSTAAPGMTGCSAVPEPIPS